MIFDPFNPKFDFLFSKKFKNIRNNYFEILKELTRLDLEIEEEQKENFSSKLIFNLYKQRTSLKKKSKNCFLACFRILFEKEKPKKIEKKQIKTIDLENLKMNKNKLYLTLFYDEVEIRIGLNNGGNNFLVKNFKNGLTFHVQNYAGSVIVLIDRANNYYEKDIQIAANIAFLNSKATEDKIKYYVNYTKGLHVYSRLKNKKYVFIFYKQKTIMALNQKFQIKDNKLIFSTNGNFEFSKELNSADIFTYLSKISNYSKLNNFIR